MTTPRDLMIVTLDAASSRPVEQGNLSLALAGAELIDLLDVRAAFLDGDRIVPGPQLVTDDRLLDAAASALVRQEPYESAEDWLWRRGNGLSSTYQAALEEEGQLARERRRWLPVPTERTALVDSPARRHAADRWASGERVLAGLAAAVGIHDKPDEDFEGSGDAGDDVVLTVLGAVHDAVMELEAVRQRRTIENAAFDNIWRGQ
ncbi:GPP34 family phosphoprotein [Streptomyces sp. R21]|uniref:GPP34 family phosphoprotein n=1 Tax=Streptomyces sp. R21 TaxID=3238627 RepID=A0AB39P3E4_9ACTN